MADEIDYYVVMRIRQWTQEDWSGAKPSIASRLVQNMISDLPEIPYAAPTCEFIKELGIPCGDGATHVVEVKINNDTEDRVFYCMKHARLFEQRFVAS